MKSFNENLDFSWTRGGHAKGTKVPRNCPDYDNTKRYRFSLDDPLLNFLGKRFFHLKLSEKSSDQLAVHIKEIT